MKRRWQYVVGATVLISSSVAVARVHATDSVDACGYVSDYFTSESALRHSDGMPYGGTRIGTYHPNMTHGYEWDDEAQYHNTAGTFRHPSCGS